jgi:hypothetical protein
MVQIPIGRAYTATAHGSCLKSVTCESCSCEYVYRLERTAKGSGASLLWADNAGARLNAQAGARAELFRVLAQGVDAVACPQCGMYQRNMFLRGKRIRFWMWFAIGVAVAGGLAWYAIGHNYGVVRNAQQFWKTMGCGGVIALVLVLLGTRIGGKAVVPACLLAIAGVVLAYTVAVTSLPVPNAFVALALWPMIAMGGAMALGAAHYSWYSPNRWVSEERRRSRTFATRGKRRSDLATLQPTRAGSSNPEPKEQATVQSVSQQDPSGMQICSGCHLGVWPGKDGVCPACKQTTFGVHGEQ